MSREPAILEFLTFAARGRNRTTVERRVKAFSEQLFEQFCQDNAISCARVHAGRGRTPDFEISLAHVRVTCEVKQLNPNDEDLKELDDLRESRATGRYVPNRLRGKLKDVSAQLKAASQAGHPTLLVVYDNTPFKTYTDHGDVIQAMFGLHGVTVSVPKDPSLPTVVSAPFFAGNRGVGPRWNTAVSAIAILEGGPEQARSLRVYHNPYAVVRLAPELFAGLPVSQPVLPDAKEVSLRSTEPSDGR